MMENKKVSEKKDSWLKVLLSYTEGSGQRLGISVILSVISIISGLMPYYCIYRGIDLYIRNLNQAPMQEILRWCLYVSGGKIDETIVRRKIYYYSCNT